MTTDPKPLAEDRLDGADAIAAFLKWPVRKVYQARERGWSTPIRKADGMGIYAFKSELVAWQTGDETLAPSARRVA